MVDFNESLFSFIPLAFVYPFDSCSVLNCSSLVYFHLLGFIGPLFQIWTNFTLFGLIFCFLIIFRYLGEAIWELGHQYSVEESHHIIATSFPRHLSDGPTLEAQEWHFYNFEWQSDNFVNMSGRFDVTTKLGLLLHATAAFFSFPLSKTSIFLLSSFGGCAWSFSTRC